MPVRLLNSSVLRWPDKKAVNLAVREWAREIATQKPEVVRVGYFGSYARGDWGVGSDVDLIIVVEHAREPFPRRAIHWDTTGLPVPAEALIYTESEWQSLSKTSRFGKTASQETVWVYERAGPPASVPEPGS
jgi:predicted nucleotidyltransferase